MDADKRGLTLKFAMPDPIKPLAEDRREPVKPIATTEKAAPPSEVAGFEVAPTKEEEEATEARPARPVAPARPAESVEPTKPARPVAPARPAAKDELTQKIEKILEEDLYELYSKLPPEKQRAFKAKGEEAAGKIRELMAHAKVKLRKLMRIIFEWLKLLPGVNRYFLEQEAKIKADKIIRLSGR